WSGYCSSLASSRSKSVKASAVAPANPPITLPPASRRTFLAVCFITVWPTDTWPSPATTTLLPLRTATIVVPCQPGKSLSLLIQHSKRICPYLGCCRLNAMAAIGRPVQETRCHAYGKDRPKDQRNRHLRVGQPRRHRQAPDRDRHRLSRS